MEAKHVNIYFAALAHLVGATLTIDNFRENWQNIGLAPPSEIYILVKSAVADLGFTEGDHQPQREGRLVNMNENENTLRRAGARVQSPPKSGTDC